MAAKMSVLGLILSSYPYLRSAMVRFPFWLGNLLRLVPLPSHGNLTQTDVVTHPLYGYPACVLLPKVGKVTKPW